MTANAQRRARLRRLVAPTPAETHIAVINRLVALGYLTHRYPLPRREFDYALVAALSAAPPDTLVFPEGVLR